MDMGNLASIANEGIKEASRRNTGDRVLNTDDRVLSFISACADLTGEFELSENARLLANAKRKIHMLSCKVENMLSARNA